LTPLSSDAKCNTPRRFDIGKLFKTLRSVAMRSYAHLSEDERDQIGVLRAAGRSMGAIAPGARSGESHHLPGAAAERTPFGRVTRRFTPEHQLRRQREAILEREAAFTSVRGGPARRRMDAHQDLECRARLITPAEPPNARGGFRREVQPRRQHWFLNEKSGFPFRTPAFCSVSRGQSRLGEKEYRAPSVTPGVALRPRTQETHLHQSVPLK
jgi:hypothetical protein